MACVTVRVVKAAVKPNAARRRRVKLSIASPKATQVVGNWQRVSRNHDLIAGPWRNASPAGPIKTAIQNRLKQAVRQAGKQAGSQ